MAKSGGKNKALAPPPSDDELTARVRDALQGRGMKTAELTKVVGKAEAPRALRLAHERAAAGDFFHLRKGGIEWFFAVDPIATLDRAVPELLRQTGPLPAKSLTAKDFKGMLEQVAPGHFAIVDDWRKGAVGRGVLFELAQPGSKKPTLLLSADPPVRATDEEMVAKLHAALTNGGKPSRELMALVDPSDGERALQLARNRAASGSFFRVRKGKDEWFFGTDPIATLDRMVPQLLRQQGPSSAKDLKATIEHAASGHSWLLADWQKGAIARGLVYELTLPGPPKQKVLSAEPDLKLQLAKTLAELCKALPALERQGITRERVLEFLRAELAVAGETKGTPAPTQHSSRQVFLEALRRFAADNPKGALLPVRELRARTGLAKQDFDAAALDLSNEGLLVLHHHDHAAVLSEADQSGLVRDALGRHYVGIALRGSA
jgi:hypothetical protein